MNEEIFKRLQDQCWIYNTHPDMVDDEGRPCGFDTKKFALLIVRECQYAIVSRQDLPAHERKLYNNVLKQHFGVDNNSV